MQIQMAQRYSRPHTGRHMGLRSTSFLRVCACQCRGLARSGFCAVALHGNVGRAFGARLEL